MITMFTIFRRNRRFKFSKKSKKGAGCYGDFKFDCINNQYCASCVDVPVLARGVHKNREIWIWIPYAASGSKHSIDLDIGGMDKNG